MLKSLKVHAPDRSLRFLLHKHLTGIKPGRPFQKVHASELTKVEGMCPRFYALSDAVAAEVGNEFLTASQVMTYDFGKMAQDAIVHHFADMKLTIGHWRCDGCKKLIEFAPRPDECPKCGCRSFTPEEVRFRSEDNHASCGVDMLVNLKYPKLIPVELKTIKNEDFRTLAGPLAEHKLRTNLYLRLIEESNHPYTQHVDTQQARILYIDKGLYGIAQPDLAHLGIKDKFSPFKEYEVYRDDSQTDALVLRARAVKRWRETKKMPTGICGTAMAKRAAGCPRKGVCFSAKHPPVIEWKELGA